MRAIIHNNNVLLNLSRSTTFGWVRELCHRTLLRGILSDADLQAVYDIFIAGGGTVTPSPAISPEHKLRLTKLVHVEGVNALKAGTEIAFCEEGITLVYGQNGKGKSGYYRALENIAGGPLASPVLANIYEEHPSNPHCRLEYKIDNVVQPAYDWDNTDATKGKAPFDKITVFDSKYTGYLVQRHTPDTYLLNTHGFFDYSDFETNVQSLVRKVQSECPEKEPELHVPEMAAINLDGVYSRYLTALQVQLGEEIKKLLGKCHNLTVEKLIDAGTPYLVVRVHPVHEVAEVLSEGEVKAIALALLLSDLELKSIKNPIVLDDPVNSLDNNIIRRLADRLISIPNPVVLFTHNVWLRNYILDSKKKVHRYSPASTLAQRTDAKRHLFAYTLTSIGKEKGIVESSEIDAAYFLQEAQSLLNKVPFSLTEGEAVTQLLRKAVERLVDEKILLKIEPCRYRGSHQYIPWDEFPQLKLVPDAIVQTLQEQYTILSAGGTHEGMSSSEDPLDHDDLEEVYNELMTISQHA